MELVQNKKLTVNLIKVKAYNRDFFNERVDSLAKEALKLQPIEISFHETGSILLPPIWKNTIIDIPIRDFVKNINKKKAINIQWSNQARNIKLFSQEIKHEDLYDWEFLWKRQKKNCWSTSMKSSKEKAF